MMQYDDDHARKYGLRIDREAFNFPDEPPERVQARRSWLRSQLAAARARGLKIITDVIG